MTLSRRNMLQGAAMLPAALIIGCQFKVNSADATPVNAWLKIAEDDEVTIALSQSEMGQDVYTTMPMLVAEELEADWSKIRVEQTSDALNPVYASPFYGAQVTAGSLSVVAFNVKLREAGAQAREMLRGAAAARWKAPIDEIQAVKGQIIHKGTGKRLSYGALAEEASKFIPPENIKLKDPSEWRILGKPTNRLDARVKVNGEALYGIDVKLPNMLTGTVRACPVFGGTLKELDDRPALAIKGVHSVVKLDTAFIVLADSYWPAHLGAEALKPVWAPGVFSNFTTAQLAAQNQALLKKPGLNAVNRGHAAKAIDAAPRVIEAAYEVPYLAHMTMEPMNGTVSVTADGLEAWLPTQAPSWHQLGLAQILGLKPEQVKIHSTFLGGGFGRRAELDFALYPALASKACARPVKVIWPREEDIQHDYYRPATGGLLRAALDKDGVPHSMSLKIAAQSISKRLGAAAGGSAPTDGPPPPDLFAVFELQGLAYKLDNWRVDYVERVDGAPVGTWRAVPNTFNGFFIESFMDEIAHKGGHDPLELRRKLLANAPRQLHVLNKTAELANWGNAPPGRHQGLAIYTEAGSVICQIAELSVSAAKNIQLHKITAVVDCGRALNPTGVEAQIQGAILDSLAAALYGEITLSKGRVEQSNFSDYPMLHMAQAPAVIVHIIDSGEALGGIGEPAVAPAPAAIANAIYAATGDRIRSLPIIKSGYTIGA